MGTPASPGRHAIPPAARFCTAGVRTISLVAVAVAVRTPVPGRNAGWLCHSRSVDAIRRFSRAQYASALESWRWLPLEGKSAVCTSPFGDIFLEDDQGVWWLDTLEGALSRPWASREEFAAALSTAEGQDEFLLAGLGMAAEAGGLRPGPDQVYGFIIPPKIGGALDASNIEVQDFVVALYIAGQIHRQIHSMPPGTKITGLTVDGQMP